MPGRVVAGIFAEVDPLLETFADSSRAKLALQEREAILIPFDDGSFLRVNASELDFKGGSIRRDEGSHLSYGAILAEQAGRSAELSRRAVR